MRLTEGLTLGHMGSEPVDWSYDTNILLIHTQIPILSEFKLLYFLGESGPDLACMPSRMETLWWGQRLKMNKENSLWKKVDFLCSSGQIQLWNLTENIAVHWHASKESYNRLKERKNERGESLENKNMFLESS